MRKTFIDREMAAAARETGPEQRPGSALLVLVLGKAAGLLCGLPVVELGPRERRAYAGLLWDIGPAVAHHVGHALLRRPALFPEIDARATGQRILEKQERARGWRCLESMLRGMADLCHDGYLYEAGTAIREATAIVDRVIAGAADPLLGPGLDHRGRGLCMLLALTILGDGRARNGGLHRKRGRGKKGG